MCHSVLDSCLWGHNTGMCIVLPVVSHCRISIFQHPPICSILHRTGILPNLTCPDGGHSCQENSQCQVSARCLLAMAAAVCPSQSFPAVIPCLPALQDGSSLLSRAWGSKAQFSTAQGAWDVLFESPEWVLVFTVLHHNSVLLFSACRDPKRIQSVGAALIRDPCLSYY